MTGAVLLETDGLACGHRRGRPVLSDLRLSVTAGASTVLVGPSGCGKTTLLKTVLGLLPPLGGRARVLGAELPAAPAAGRVGYVPQGLGLVAHASVLRNVLTGLLPQTGGLRGLVGAYRRDHVERARAALDRVGLADHAAAKPLRLSGGQRRRVAVARALAQRPALLVADEIVSELDDATAARVLDAVAGLQRETGMGMLLVEHDLERSSAVADVLCCVGNGGLLATLGPGPERAERARQVVAGCAG